MSLFADRVFETTTTTGTGTYSLAGAQTGYRGFADAFSNGATVFYHCRNADGTVWESGYGTLDTGAGTITRNLLESSTAALINWTAGTKYIYGAPLGSILASLAAGNIGTARPGWLPTGGSWADSANSLLKYWNGTSDVPLLPLGARTQGDILYHGASGVAALLGAGTAGQFLKTGGAAANPSWGWGLHPGPSSELTIATGAVTATGGFHTVDTEADAASDDLDTVTVTALPEGALLVLAAENTARVVTVKDGTGNMTLAAGDFVMDRADKRLVLQKVGSALYEVARSGSGLANGASIATTSGTAHDFTGLPAGVKRITLSFSGVSLSGTDNLLVQLGDAGGFETTGYVSTSGNLGGAAVSATAGFIVRDLGATNVLSGHMILTRHDAAGFTWVASHAVKTGTGNIVSGGGDKSLSAVLDRVRLTRDGTDTFDAGSVNIMWEA